MEYKKIGINIFIYAESENVKLNIIEMFEKCQHLVLRLIRSIGLVNYAEYVSIRKVIALESTLKQIRSLRAEVEIFGLPFQFDPLRTTYSELTGSSGLAKMFDHDCYGLRYIRDSNPVVLDIGSHVGLFPRVVKKMFEKPTIYSLEPDRDNFKLLKINNGVLTNANSFQLGVLDCDSTLFLRESDENSWRSTLSVNGGFFRSDLIGEDAFSRDCYEVPVISIDNFVVIENINKVDLIGITVPGEIEFLILNGAIETLKKFRPILSLVVYPSQQEPVNELLGSLNYQPADRSYGNHKIFLPS